LVQVKGILMKNNVVIVYGSGASYASGYKVKIYPIIDIIDRSKIVIKPPTDQNFFEEIPEKSIKSKYKAISHFKDKFYQPGKNCSLEEIWTDVDINHKHIKLDTYSWKFESHEYLLNPNYNYSNMDLIYEHFDGVYFNTSPVYNKYKFLGDCGRDFRRLIYDIYSNYIMPTGEDYLKQLHTSLNGSKYSNIAYVTFNYDCFLEQSLTDIRLKYITLNDKTDCYNTLMHDGIPIIKLHGSLSWEESRNGAIYKIIYKAFPYSKNSQVEPKYKHDGDWLQPAIIPPTILKQEINDDSKLEHDLTKTILQQWRAAITLLTEADLIIIVGYSFPVADHHVGRLFRLSNAIRKRKRRNPPIILYCCGLNDNIESKREVMHDLYGADSQIFITSQFEKLVKSSEFKDIIR
jgi:SIR2-like protein